MEDFVTREKRATRIIIIGLLGVVAIAYYIITNTFSYFDPWRLCYVSIHGDILAGDKGTIRQSLKFLKHNDPKSYESICKYVNIIGEEKYCIYLDPTVEKTGDNGFRPSPCYIRGSKAIYITPIKGSSREIIETRAGEIVYGMKLSEKYWKEAK